MGLSNETYMRCPGCGAEAASIDDVTVVNENSLY